jgi:peptide/nickel transport system substrate-binding protein
MTVTRNALRLSAATFAALIALPSLALEYHEAPMLAERVAAGTLPPLAERLPVDPEVVTPFESIGHFGGTLRFGLAGVADEEQITYWVGNQGLVRYDPETNFSTVIPNIAKSFDVDSAGKVFTFHLREGVKWSDGTLLTADDIAFNMEDFVLNPEWGDPQGGYKSNGKPVKFRKIDNLTVEFAFEDPSAEFLATLADRRYMDHLIYQKAHCSQFHPRYNTTNLDELLKAAGTTDWRILMVQECGDASQSSARFANPKRPTLEAWVITQGYTANATQVELERNPYFWMVDSEGNQLPYADKLVAPIYSDSEALLLGAIGGNFDFEFRELATPSNRPVLAENQAAGDYSLYEVTPIGGSPAVVFLNLTHKDSEYRSFLSQKDFRAALSLGIDRQEIIDTVFLGAGEPWNNAPYEDSPMYHERYAKQFLEYDPDRANAMLDALGLDKRDSDGTRLLPSGRRLTLKIDMATGAPELSGTLELMALQWAKIGVDLDVTTVERSLMVERILNNDHDMAMWEDNTSWLPGKIPNGMVPLVYDARWGIAWVDWRQSGGTKGEEPPASIKERYRLYDLTKAAPTFEQRHDLYMQIADIAADEFEVFAITKNVSNYGVKANDLHNVRPTHPDSSQYPPSLMLPWTWYKD